MCETGHIGLKPLQNCKSWRSSRSAFFNRLKVVYNSTSGKPAPESYASKDNWYTEGAKTGQKQTIVPKAVYLW